jgi:8-oxo-dGTP diphosphatase
VKLATLLYIKNSKDEYLLLERLKKPNKGLLSPPGGKLLTESAESPFACAVREAEEECGIISTPRDWKLIGIITEKDYPAMGNIMMFLLEYKHTLNTLPPDIHEGRFDFYHPRMLGELRIPLTDKLYLWNFVLNGDNQFFCASIDCSSEPYQCTVELD